MSFVLFGLWWYIRRIEKSKEKEKGEGLGFGDFYIFIYRRKMGVVFFLGCEY